MVGFEVGIGPRSTRMKYDAIIIGTGAAGGIVAGVLAEAGKHVLLLERGRALSFSQVGRDHLRNQRLSIYGHNAGPELEVIHAFLSTLPETNALSNHTSLTIITMLPAWVEALAFTARKRGEFYARRLPDGEHIWRA